MAEETVVAESSAAVAAEPTFTQFDGWDEDGNPVVNKKEETPEQGEPEDADSAAADATKVSKEAKSEDAADSAANRKQGKHRSAEARIKELAAENKRLKAEAEEARKPKETKPAESSTAKAAETKPAAAPETRPKPTLKDVGTDGKAKYGSYEDFQDALTDWSVEQKLAARDREQQVQQHQQALGKQLEEARGRYTDFDSVTKPLIQELYKPDISREVLAVLNDSPVLTDLLYTIGGTEASRADFLDACRTNPGKALRVALLMEQEIKAELGKGKAAEKKAGEGEAAPVIPKPRAPKPPAEVGGRGASGEDALVAAARDNNYPAFAAEQTRRALAARK